MWLAGTSLNSSSMWSVCHYVFNCTLQRLWEEERSKLNTVLDSQMQFKHAKVAREFRETRLELNNSWVCEAENFLSDSLRFTSNATWMNWKPRKSFCLAQLLITWSRGSQIAAKLIVNELHDSINSFSLVRLFDCGSQTIEVFSLFSFSSQLSCREA
jgi:hypothetical protein